MADLTVSTDVDNFMGSADTAAMRAAAEVDMRTDVNGAVSIGDLGGNARGANAINIQASRSDGSQVASGDGSVTIGNGSTASGYYPSVAIGKGSTASGSDSTAIGPTSTASGNYDSVAIGKGSTASGDYDCLAIGNNATASAQYNATALGSFCQADGDRSTASGYRVIANGDDSTAFGRRVTTTIDKTTEIGYWSGGSTRGGAIRAHGTGMVAMTIQNRSTAFGDGGATAGTEADNTVIREGIAFRRNGNEILIDLNIAGTVTTLSLGTAS